MIGVPDENSPAEKDNPVIVFRGKLDKLNAMILEAQLLGEEKENPGFVNDILGILDFTRSLFTVEYKNITPGEIRILGLSSSEIQEQSHHPEKYFGREHILINSSMGALCLRLNLLRTVTRETELAAVAVLRESEEDAAESLQYITEALNRLSGLFYILIYKYLPDNYTINPYDR